MLKSFTFIEQNGLQRYNLEAPKAMVPEALASVGNASIRGFYGSALRAICAFSEGAQYGREEYRQNAYRSRRRSRRQMEAVSLAS